MPSDQNSKKKEKKGCAETTEKGKGAQNRNFWWIRHGTAPQRATLRQQSLPTLL
jgi:hypothetical protein